ncbi:MAG: Ada metal-binding domain-containing protein [Thermodesulfobacteriota bacterium]
MSDKPGKIDWKKRLEAMKQGQLCSSSQPVITSPEPRVNKSPIPQKAPVNQPEPEIAQVQKVKTAVREVKSTDIPFEPAVSLPEHLVQRLEKLEGQVRSLKIVGIGVVLLVMLLLPGLVMTLSKGSGRSPVIIGESLTIKDPGGICRLWVGERDGQVQVELRDQAGKPRLGLGLGAEGEPRLIFYNRDRKILTQIVPLTDSQPGIKLLNQVGESVATIPIMLPAATAIQEPQAATPLPTPTPQSDIIPQETPKTEQKSETSSGEPLTSLKNELFVASPGGKAYHLPTCSWVENIPSDKLLKFSSGAEAVKAGYHPCRRCRPDRKD